MRHTLTRLPAWLPQLALLAAVVALLAPSEWLADHSDVLLALLVLATALGIRLGDLLRLRARLGVIAALSVLPIVVLGAGAWALGRPFAAPVRDGLLAVGLSSTEVAAVGLVALAGADAALALGVLAGSLVASALAGPLLIGALAGGAHVAAGSLLGRFALVVLLPLAAGVALRSIPPAQRALPAVDAEREGGAALTVVLLIYAALSGTRHAHHLGAALLASTAFLLVSGAFAELLRRRSGRHLALPGALVVGMRDFAVAAVLATQAFGHSAGAVSGVYGVLMLIAGAIVAGRLPARV